MVIYVLFFKNFEKILKWHSGLSKDRMKMGSEKLNPPNSFCHRTKDRLEVFFPKILLPHPPFKSTLFRCSVSTNFT